MSNVDPLARIAELPAVQEAVQHARTTVDRLFGHRVLRRRGSDVAMEATLRGARASAALAGADVPLEVLRAQGAADTGETGERHPDDAADGAGTVATTDGGTTDARVRGALRIYGDLGPLVQTWSTAPRQVLARLHTLAAADLVAPEHLGRPREAGHAPPVVDLESTTAADGPLGEPPASAELTARLQALGQLVSTRSAAPALVTSSVVHGELMVLRPFGWGDGLVARAAERLTLIDLGLDPKALAPTEIGHAQDLQQYRTALAAYRSGTPEGISQWIAHCSEAVASGARETLATCEALMRG
ncbi:oxidoreductase [Lipingzhangella sp. LS1_29]|uniref:Oxidoreductase n=1 Tax=Lipingzhangella rawalii TaxID=2055835 RepID=A0ABU2H405_9ACTN|nr:oxidoreductase [Lipingzhangella rawalii]MDS1270025.1 oxidoreductase [Lipingzhangella rawalii]